MARESISLPVVSWRRALLGSSLALAACLGGFAAEAQPRRRVPVPEDKPVLAAENSASPQTLAAAPDSSQTTTGGLLRRNSEGSTPAADNSAPAAQVAQTNGGTMRRPDALPPGTEAAPYSPYKSEHKDPPAMSDGAQRVDFDRGRFGNDPDYSGISYDAKAQIEIYGGKSKVIGPRPALELGHPMYQEGPLPDSINLFGEKNPSRPQLLVYGDWRTAVAWNDNGNKETGLVATRLNLDVDLRLTSTERIHLFTRPLDDGRNGKFTSYEFFGDDRNQGFGRLDGNIDALFFEGDLGAIAAGISDSYNIYDIPIAFGFMPLLFQNGLWFEDAMIGGAITYPARNSRWLDISNMDFTFFYGGDRVTTQAIKDKGTNLQDDHSAEIFGVAAFAEALSGYFEAGYGYTHDTRGTGFNFDYHNATLAFSRRYGGWLSNSLRAVVNFGQKPDLGQRQTADGFLLVAENSLITHLPLTLVPYANFFYGKDRPQSLARDFGAGGILKTVGINFETDGLTGFPKLDDTANDTFGGAIGIEYLFSLEQQIVLEAASLHVIGPDNKPGRVAKSDQRALGIRYQRPLDRAWIFRTDLIRAWRDEDTDFAGIRFELRRKF